MNNRTMIIHCDRVQDVESGTRNEPARRDGFTAFEFLAVSALVAIAVTLAILFQQTSPISSGSAMSAAEEAAFSEPFTKLQLTADHSQLVGLHRNGVVSSRHLVSAQALKNLEQPWSDPDWIRSDTVLAVSSDCRHLLTLQKDGMLAVCPFEDCAVPVNAHLAGHAVLLENSRARIEDCQALFSVHGDLVAVLRNYRRDLTVWDVTTGDQLWTLTRDEDEPAFSRMAFAGNGDCLVAGSMTAVIEGFDPHSGVTLWTVRRKGLRPSSIDISSDGARLCLGYLRPQRALEIVDIATGEVCWCDDQGCGGTRIARFVAGDRLIMSCGLYGSIRLRDAMCGDELAELWGHSGAVCDIVEARADTTVFTVDQTGPVRTWDLSSFVPRSPSANLPRLTDSH